jgi:phosphomevalonate kinase
VGSASFGCLRYVRFSPSLLDASKALTPAQLNALVAPHGAFDHNIQRWRLPHGVSLMVGDVQVPCPSAIELVSKCM